MKTAAAGDRALLVDLERVSASELHAAARSVKSIPGVVTCIVGHSSLYVIFRDRADLTAVVAAIHAAPRSPSTGNRQLRFTVSFADDYGLDLAEFLARVGTTRDDFMNRIRDVRLVARYLGFRGGFAYLDGWPAEWAMPRRPTSRPVRRGSFAIAGAVAAFYPIDTPGGWNILARTNGELRIEPGDEITIVPTLEKISSPPPQSERRVTIAGVEIDGPLAIVTDNPFDVEAAELANLAVGNSLDAPVIECAMVVPKVRTDGVTSWVGPDGVVRHELPVGKIEGGLRGYIGIGVDDRRPRLSELIRPKGQARRLSSTIQAMAGPHDIGLREVECEVTPQLDRVGIRLRPLKPIGATAPADLPSCGMQCGTVQLHPDGSLMVMGPDHPVTGGYLQPMTVISSERWKLAQLSPGERVLIVVQPP